MFINSYPWGLVGRCRVGISGSGLVNQSGIVDVGLFFKSAKRLICFIVFILFICWIWDGLSSCVGLYCSRCIYRHVSGFTHYVTFKQCCPAITAQQYI